MDALSIVKSLAEWSEKYPRCVTYPMSQKKMDDELIAIEEQAKAFMLDKAAQSKGGWTEMDMYDAFLAGGKYEKDSEENFSFEELIEHLKTRNTQQAIYKNYPNLNASKEEMDEMRKLK